MKQFYRAIGVILLMSSYAHGQPMDTTKTAFTLQECIDYALKNSVNAENAVLDQTIAQAKVRETRGLGLPQVTGNSSLTYNEKLRRFFALKQTAFGFSGLPSDQYSTFLPGVADKAVVAEQSFFQLKGSGDVGVTISQMIFSGSYIVGLQASKAYTELAYKTTNQTKEQIIMQVTKAYYSVLINKERTKLFTSNIGRVDSLLRNTKAQNENGFAESIDVDRIQVTYNNLLTQRDNFLNTEQLSQALLKFQMNYPLEKNIDVIGNISDVQVESDVEAYKQNWDYKSRPDYKVLEANQKLQQLNIKNQYYAAMPYIGASANYGYYTQSANISGLFKTNTPIKDVNGLGPDKWYGYTTYSVTASIPIFTGFQRHYRVQQEKMKLTKIDNSFRALKQSINLEVAQSSTSFQNAVRMLGSQKQNMDLAGKVARVTKIKYQQGVGSNLEVVDAEDSLRQAQTNYYSALFDAMVAKVDLDKAFGKILPSSQTN